MSMGRRGCDLLDSGMQKAPIKATSTGGFFHIDRRKEDEMLQRIGAAMRNVVNRVRSRFNSRSAAGGRTSGS